MPFTRTIRMTPFLAFHLRSKKNQGPAMLYIRLSFNSVRTTEYKSGILVEVSSWPELPDFHPGSGPVKMRIAQVRAEHDWIALRMKNPTAEAIKEAWIETQAPKPVSVEEISTPLLAAYGQYVAYKLKPPARRPEGWRPMAEKTAQLLHLAGRHLGSYLQLIGKVTITLAEIRASFGYNFGDYLLDQGMMPDTANRFLHHVSDAIAYSARQELCENNPLSGIAIKSQSRKRIDFFTEADLEKLVNLSLGEALNTARNWVLLMCYTGLDYHDALEVTANLEEYYRRTPSGAAIVYQRLKYAYAPQWGECHIPVLPQAEKLLAESPNWRRPSLASMNQNIKSLAKKMEVSFKPRTKHCRKTAALIFMLYYENIQVVQKVLGHQSIATTEKFYAYMPPEIVYKAMSRKTESLTENTPKAA